MSAHGRIPLSVPSIEGNEWKYVKDCLGTGWISSLGSYVDRFEREFAAFTGASYAVACVNGTAAIHTALMMVGVNEGDEVLAPTLTFIAPINAIEYCNARPVLFDADRYYNIDAKLVLDFLRDQTEQRPEGCFNKRTGARIGAFLPVHIFGNAVELDDLVDACRSRKIPIVEDATESLGSRYQQGTFAGRYTGTIGDIGCFSFNGNKIITTGGGGMLVTNRREFADRGRYLTTQAKDDAKRYVHHEVGFNYRLTNVLAAIGVAQLEKLPEYLLRKRHAYRYYQEQIPRIPGLTLAETPAYAENNLWMFALQIDEKIYGLGREALMSALESQGIETRPVWFLNHHQRPFQGCQFVGGGNADKLLERTLNIPCSVTLTQQDQARVVECLRTLCGS